MTIAPVVDLATRLPVDQPTAPIVGGDGWTLPPGAVPLDCVAFGKLIRTVERLTERVAKLEQRLRDVERVSARRSGSE